MINKRYDMCNCELYLKWGRGRCHFQNPLQILYQNLTGYVSTISYYFYAVQKIEVQVGVPLFKSAYVHSKSYISSDKNKITCGFACRFKTCVKYKESAVTIHFNRRKMPLPPPSQKYTRVTLLICKLIYSTIIL